MNESIPRSLRTAERYLVEPPLRATFGPQTASVCDISATGARFRHDDPVQTGAKGLLQIPDASAGGLESVVVWTKRSTSGGPRFVTGVRTLGGDAVLEALLRRMAGSRRVHRIEELRSTDRFTITPALDAAFNGVPVVIEDLSARGARIVVAPQPPVGSAGSLTLRTGPIDLTVAGTVVWTREKSIDARGVAAWSAGLRIDGRPDGLRLTIGHLCEEGRASIDTHSLELKRRILRARARDRAEENPSGDTSAVAYEQILLVESVREELRVNTDEAMFYYRKARLAIADPATRIAAPAIADHPDALAVWEYLDRSVDPTVIGRSFRLL